MAIELITVRRKDDHTVTTRIAPGALRHFPDFERVPDADADEVPTAESPAASGGPAPDSDPKTQRRAAAADKKEK
ncbi:hypothetical protein [Actinomadura luteofluorescens]|uniref:hypothetical protein n=1 Tax=Actinomadura luteofluorescens TaxID=46163 RepID=UPI003D904C4F